MPGMKKGKPGFFQSPSGSPLSRFDRHSVVPLGSVRQTWTLVPLSNNCVLAGSGAMASG